MRGRGIGEHGKRVRDHSESPIKGEREKSARTQEDPPQTQGYKSEHDSGDSDTDSSSPRIVRCATQKHELGVLPSPRTNNLYR